MVRVVLPLLLLLFSSCTGSLLVAHAEVDELNYIVVTSNSLEPEAVCSGFRVNPPSGNVTGSWVPLSRSHGPCSPAAAAADSAQSVMYTLQWDQFRADYIQRKLSGNASDEKADPDLPPLGPPAQTTNVGQDNSHEPTMSNLLGSAKPNPPSPMSVAIDPAATTGTGRRQRSGGVQTMVLDTASDVPWLQCAPCPIPPCHPQTDVLYDPGMSATSATFSCTSPTCRQLGRYGNGCARDSQCLYRVQYPDGSSTAGTYISDVLRLSPAGRLITNFKFGCSHAVQGSLSFSRQTAGIMALGRGAQSLVSQTKGTYGDAFSYCLPPTASTYGFFTLGVPRVSSSRFVVTPMLRSSQAPMLYLVRLQAITVAGQRLNVPPPAFAAGAVMDSRAVITRLPPTAYGALRSAFRDRMRAYRAAAPKGQLDTCYDFRGVRAVALPRIALVFDRNAAVELDPSGILFNGCLAFASNGDDRLAGTIGNVQQQTLEVLYDVGGGSMGFRRGAC